MSRRDLNLNHLRSVHQRVIYIVQQTIVLAHGVRGPSGIAYKTFRVYFDSLIYLSFDIFWFLRIPVLDFISRT